MPLIDGVRTKALKVIPDERGWLMEGLRADDEIFTRFGQMYVSATYPGVVKGWHYHRRQVDNFVCVSGMIKLVIYDGREGSPTKGEINEFFLGDRNPLLVQVPAGAHHGWKCVSDGAALVVNCPTEPYDYQSPDEVRFPPHGGDVPYDWSRKDG
jgi:dTDP-4-dehydrorhamnose 3,5-epimerase